MNIERIEELLLKDKFSNEDKAEIKAAAEAAQAGIVFRDGCRRCYEKALLKLYELETNASAEEVVSLDGYALKVPSLRLRVGGQVVSVANLADIRVEENFPPMAVQFLFKKIETTEAE